jgi:hypothetical protein
VSFASSPILKDAFMVTDLILWLDPIVATGCSLGNKHTKRLNR